MVIVFPCPRAVGLPAPKQCPPRLLTTFESHSENGFEAQSGHGCKHKRPSSSYYRHGKLNPKVPILMDIN